MEKLPTTPHEIVMWVWERSRHPDGFTMLDAGELEMMLDAMAREIYIPMIDGCAEPAIRRLPFDRAPAGTRFIVEDSNGNEVETVGLAGAGLHAILDRKHQLLRRLKRKIIGGRLILVIPSKHN